MTVEEILEIFKKEEYVVTIDECVFNQPIKLDFEGLQADTKYIFFKNCVFEEDVQIVNLEGTYLFDYEHDPRNHSNPAPYTFLRFERCTFNGSQVLFKNVKAFYLTTSECVFQQLRIVNSILPSVDIKESTLNECMILGSESIYFKIEESVITLLILDSPNLENAHIKAKHIENLYLRNLKNVRITGGVKEVKLEAKEFESVYIQPEYWWEKSSIKRFVVSDIILKGDIRLEKTYFEELKFWNVRSSSGMVLFNEINIDFSGFVDCTISDFYWNQVHFEKGLWIKRCDLSTLKLTNVRWLQDKKLSNSFLDDQIPLFHAWRHKRLKEETDIEDYYELENLPRRERTKKTGILEGDLTNLRYERDTYRQLKAASTANHNHIEALEFYRNEMRLYWKEIRINGGVRWHDRILVFTNRWVSDFGQNWFLPIFWLFLFHTLMYCCIIHFQFKVSSTAFDNGIGQYFELLNPVHKTPDYIQGSDIAIEFFLRILNGFFIYHFIKATRKMIKA